MTREIGEIYINVAGPLHVYMVCTIDAYWCELGRGEAYLGNK